MDEWHLLEKILLKWEKGSLDVASTEKALDSLNEVNMPKLTRILCKEKPGEVDPRIALFGKLFTLFNQALDIGIRHEVISIFPEHCKDLARSGVYIPSSLTFSQNVISRYAANKQDSREAANSFEGLLVGVNEINEDLAKASALILSALIPQLHKTERSMLLKKIGTLPARLRKVALIPTLKKYCEIIDRAEESIRHQDYSVKSPCEVISVHSHKGGVGKTFVATALAVVLSEQKNRRVCLVDCDDEGPSLFNALPFQKKKPEDLMFFVDWFCSRISTISLEKISQISVNGNTIYCIPGSWLATDITRLDEKQHGKRPRGAIYTYGQYRIAELIKLLKKKLRFDFVILDTGPGLAHLALDVLMATLSLGGSQIFVMRPRMVDIGQFCIEWDWLYSIKKKGKSNVVINFTCPKHKDLVVDLENANQIVEQMKKSPQFQIFEQRLFGINEIESQVAKIVMNVWKEKAPIHVLSENEQLRFAENISISPQNRTVEVVLQDDEIRKVIEDIISELAKRVVE